MSKRVSIALSKSPKLSEDVLRAHNDSLAPATLRGRSGPVADTDRDSSTDRNNSLHGFELATKAYCVTRRLSMSTYMLDLNLEAVPQPQAKNVNLEPTYKMKPDEGEAFPAIRIKTLIQNILEKNLAARDYESEKCKSLTTSLSHLIKNRVKEIDMPRYKLVCNVMLGQKQQNSLQTVSRCVWDSSTDNFACGVYENDSLYAVACVYGIYFE